MHYGNLHGAAAVLDEERDKKRTARVPNREEAPLQANQIGRKLNVAALLRASVCCVFTLFFATVHVTFSH